MKRRTLKPVEGRIKLFIISCFNTFAVTLKKGFDRLDRAVVVGRLDLMYRVGFDDGVREAERRERQEGYAREDAARAAAQARASLENCTAEIWTGPGHQTRRKCAARGPHDQHFDSGGDYFWTTKKAYSGFFNESPQHEGEKKIRRVKIKS
jgi:hypothetical protein